MRPNARLIQPLDPECDGAKKIEQYAMDGSGDPMTQHYGAYDVIRDQVKSMESKHRETCQRCREYGAANIDVDTGD